MGNNFGPVVNYHCLNDCRQEGCPGHAARFGYSRSSDVEFFGIDGKIEYYLDVNFLKAVLESKTLMEAEYKRESKRRLMADTLTKWYADWKSQSKVDDTGDVPGGELFRAFQYGVTRSAISMRERAMKQLDVVKDNDVKNTLLGMIGSLPDIPKDL